MSLARWRVPVGYGAGVVAVILAYPTWLGLAIGFGLVAVGEGLRVWASGHIEKTQRLATGGPYAHTQSPLYLGSTLMALGFVVAAQSLWVAAAVLVYFLAFYPRVIREEGAFLAGKFPEHAAWSVAVPRFWPRLRPAGPAATQFEWRRVTANREWRTCLAVPAGFALLVLLLVLRARWGSW